MEKTHPTETFVSLCCYETDVNFGLNGHEARSEKTVQVTENHSSLGIQSTLIGTYNYYY